MPYWTHELINLALRWVHVVAAIFWLGQTALFTWMETRLRVERDGSATSGRGAELWMVHGGGYFRVEKMPWQVPPRVLHWFKWEAAVTWGSGLLLLGWVYHGGHILVPPGSPLGGWTDLLLALGVLAGGWVVYDLLWTSPLARRPRHARGRQDQCARRPSRLLSPPGRLGKIPARHGGEEGRARHHDSLREGCRAAGLRMSSS
jgi:uncharacterized membrane protein